MWSLASAVSPLFLLLVFTGGGLAQQQQPTTPDLSGCLRLLGSVACPGFEGAFLHPQNLTQPFPWFSSVNSVASFDAAALNYFSDPNQYSRTQFENKLGCTNATGATLRYARTVLCSMWTNNVWSRQCSALLDSSSILESPKMVCRDTCEKYAASEKAIVSNAQYCPGPDLTSGFRQGNMTKDYVQCTNWTTLATTNTTLCVSGSANEGNCGFGSSISQLCFFCSGGSPDECCYNSARSLGTCGYTLPVLPPASPTNTTRTTSTNTSDVPAGASRTNEPVVGTRVASGLSGGAKAGIAVGAVVGGLLLLSLLFCLHRRRKRAATSPSNRTGATTISATTGAAAAYRGIDQASDPTTSYHASDSSHCENGQSQKQNGIDMQPTSAAAFSSQTMGSAPLAGSPIGSGVGAGVGTVATASASVAEAVGVAAMENKNVPLELGSIAESEPEYIYPGETVTTLWAYNSALADELDLRPGLKVRISRLFDDSWAYGTLLEGPQAGRQGAFPMVCVTKTKYASISSNSLNRRTSVDTPRGTSLSNVSLVGGGGRGGATSNSNVSGSYGPNTSADAFTSAPPVVYSSGADIRGAGAAGGGV